MTGLLFPATTALLYEHNVECLAETIYSDLNSYGLVGRVGRCWRVCAAQRIDRAF